MMNAMYEANLTNKLNVLEPELCLSQAQTHLPQVHSLCVFLVKDPALVADNDIMRDYPNPYLQSPRR